MPSFVQLSSSPPRIFARSPTQVDFSSPPHSSNQASRRELVRQLPRRSITSTRNGLPIGFTSPRKVLIDKLGAENVPTLQAARFSPVNKQSSASETPIPYRSPRFVGHAPERSHLLRRDAQTVAVLDSFEDSECVIVKVLPSDLKKNKKPAKKARTNTSKVPARRTDWTPPRYATVWDESPQTRQLGFGDQLAQFGHIEEDSSFEKLANATDGEFTKRRRLDLIETRSEQPTAKPAQPAKDRHKKKASRNKSPPKKPLTITGLATARHLGQEQEKSTPMMQYLVSTQAKMGEDQNCSTFETKLKKKTAPRPKKQGAKSRLKSPKTVMKTLDSQEVIFASASQLARDEEQGASYHRPHIIDTPSKDLMSDPFPTQQSAITSIESATPLTGASRYRSHKSLWSVADRDDDNALLHFHDEFDTPFLKEGFAGKDVLLEPTVGEVPSTGHSGKPIDRRVEIDSSLVFDISDITTPTLINSAKGFPLVTKRTYSSSSKTPSGNGPKRSEVKTIPPSSRSTVDAEISLLVPSVSAPEKPEYSLWSDEELKYQLKLSGVKGMRKRENMIKRLDMLWATAKGIEYATLKMSTKSKRHGDFLSKVHDFTQRPTPKVKKSRVKKAKTADMEHILDGRPGKQKQPPGLDEDENREFYTQQDQNVSEDASDSNHLLDGVGNATALALFLDEHIAHNDSIAEPSTAPQRGTGVKASNQRPAKIRLKGHVQSSLRVLTPLPTIPLGTTTSSPGFEDLTSVTSVEIDSVAQSDQSLKPKIMHALRQVSGKDGSRNHQLDPTWWEKIQMYDPIVLEDFTTWLNTEGFGSIGEDGEIDANEVKAWCEEVGVCCLWKGGWRGNKVNKTGD